MRLGADDVAAVAAACGPDAVAAVVAGGREEENADAARLGCGRVPLVGLYVDGLEIARYLEWPMLSILAL